MSNKSSITTPKVDRAWDDVKARVFPVGSDLPKMEHWYQMAVAMRDVARTLEWEISRSTAAFKAALGPLWGDGHPLAVVAKLRQELQRKDAKSQITLTVAEILDLAIAANIVGNDHTCDEDPDTEFTIWESEHGVVIRGDDQSEHPKYRHGAYITEYREEGTYPLGSPMDIQTEMI